MQRCVKTCMKQVAQKMAGKAAEKVKDGGCSSVPLFPWMSWTAVLVLRQTSRLP